MEQLGLQPLNEKGEIVSFQSQRRKIMDLMKRGESEDYLREITNKFKKNGMLSTLGGIEFSEWLNPCIDYPITDDGDEIRTIKLHKITSPDKKQLRLYFLTEEGNISKLFNERGIEEEAENTESGFTTKAIEILFIKTMMLIENIKIK